MPQLLSMEASELSELLSKARCGTDVTTVMTLAITPTNAANILYIDVVVYATPSVASGIMSAALFQDSTAGALAAIPQRNNAATQGVILTFRHKMTAGTTSSTTFKVRVGFGGAATVTFNGDSAARRFGGVMASSITITEKTP